MHEWVEWLEQSKLAEIIRRDLWFYPILEIIHIIGIVLLVGTAIMFDLRILGFSKNISVTKLSHHLLPWSHLSLLVILPSGFLLFITNAVSLANDPVFKIKLSLIVLGGLNALIFHQTAFRSVSQWDKDKLAPVTAKALAVFSILIWLSVICCGRLLAY